MVCYVSTNLCISELGLGLVHLVELPLLLGPEVEFLHLLHRQPVRLPKRQKLRRQHFVGLCQARTVVLFPL